MSLLISTVNTSNNNGRIHVTENTWEENQLNNTSILEDTYFNSTSNNMLRILGTKEIIISNSTPTKYFAGSPNIIPRNSYYMIDLGEDWVQLDGVDMSKKVIIATLYNPNVVRYDVTRVENLIGRFSLVLDIPIASGITITDYEFGLACDQLHINNSNTISEVAAGRRYLAFRTDSDIAMSYYNNRANMVITIKYLDIEVANGAIIDNNQFSAAHDIELTSGDIKLNGLNIDEFEHLLAPTIKLYLYPYISCTNFVLGNSRTSGARVYPTEYNTCSDTTSFFTSKDDKTRCNIINSLPKTLDISKNSITRFTKLPITNKIYKHIPCGSHIYTTADNKKVGFKSHYTESILLHVSASAPAVFTVTPTSISPTRYILLVVLNTAGRGGAFLLNTDYTDDTYNLLYLAISSPNISATARMDLVKSGTTYTISISQSSTTVPLKAYIY